MPTTPPRSDRQPNVYASREASARAVDALSGCHDGLLTPEGRACSREALDAVWGLRNALAEDPGAVGALGRYERRYEASLGLAVVPSLLVRALAPRSGADERFPVVSELRRELAAGGGRSLKMRVYERSLGLAVVPVLVRRARYRRRLRAAAETGRP